MDAVVIQTREEFEQLSNQYQNFILFKHSLTCPISAEAKREFDLFCKETDTPVFILYVQKARDLSNEIAFLYSVKHESPQILIFKNNQVIWSDSHSNIKHDLITRQVEQTLK
ncbi:bacillithiol system redox-active protein YtxJ [Sediminibacillus albus]|uniref:Bacillithiol system protein YtxJ n=1 Tax=Sediminibacillus albus TaxID=407036 RepID=A0A1G9BXE7_9BACI|nr:bacillithiol system redox-active protein YtxJ [Sediminibacillus albus]SDK44067.1 bacillithiol system protein YtxJ [Sediminibacillus albus]